MTIRTESIVGGVSEHNSGSDPQRVALERQVLFQVIDALNSAASLGEFLAQVHVSLQKILSAKNCCLALYDQQSGMFDFPFYVDQFDAPPLPASFGRSCAAHVFRSGRPMLVTSELFEQLAAAGEVEQIGTPARSWLGVPLRTRSEALGVLLVQDYENENAYGQSDLTLLDSIGGLIARAIEYDKGAAALQKQQTDYEVIFHSAPLMIMYKDTNNRVLWANRAAAHAFGKTVKEIEGCSVYDLCPSEAVPYHQDDLEVIRTGLPKLGIVEPLRLATGDVRILSTDRIPYRNHEGEIIGVVLFASDVTEKQRAQDAMRRSEVNYRSVVQGAPYGICRVGQDGHLFNVNPALVNMLGYSSEKELLAANLDREIFREAGARGKLLREGEEILDNAEVAWIRKDGTAIQVQLSGWPVRDPEWPSTCYELIAENVTEQRALEQQFRQAQKMEAVGRLAGGIAHDFNNLLMVIKGHSELLHDREQTDDPRSRANLEQIQKAADRATRLTRQLLAFSRMQMLQPKIIDLNEVVADMGKMLPRLIGENIDLRMELKPGLERVKADPGQIEQVIMNLVVNARDAMPQGGKIVIETGNAVFGEAFARLHPGLPAGRYAMLAVTDTGTGMDAETQAHIFEPFFTTKEIGKGTGLGLATVYGVVKQSGGHISVDSQPGKGAAFKIYLPSVLEAAEPSSSDSQLQHAVPAGSGTVLIAEDEKEVRALAREFLSLSGYTVLEACDGVEAMEIAASNADPIDLLITDVIMPRMGGRELAARITALSPATKILYISGYAEYAPYQEESSDTSSWLSKPFTRMALARIVDQLLRAPKS